MRGTDDMRLVVVLVVGSLLYLAAVAAAIAAEAGIPLPTLALFFDGHLYLEIAKSFPLPYGSGSLDYTGYAAGYPALAWLVHALSPDALVGWGTAMLLSAWVPAALCTGVFYVLCKEFEVPAVGGALLFLFANPRWVATSATAHSEPVAMLLVLLAFVAYFRDQLAITAICITIAGFARHPAVMLIAPLALDQLLRGERGLRLLWLGLPLAGQGLVHLYLSSSVEGFESVPQTLRLFWQPELTWPFASFFSHPWNRPLPYDFFLSEVTIAFAVFYVAAIVVGFRPAERAYWVLPAWVALDVLAHASLSGGTGVLVFTRIVILAWPAALLIVLRLVRARLTTPVLLVVVIACVAFSTAFSVRYPAQVVPWQSQFLRGPLSLRMNTLEHPEPRWIQFPRRK